MSECEPYLDIVVEYGMLSIINICTSNFVLMDKFGNRGWVACFGAAVTVPVGPLLLYTDMPAVLGYVVIGVTFTFTVVSLWSSIPHVVPPHVLGTANGIASCMLDLSVGLTSLVVGRIMSASQDGEGETTTTGWKYVFLLIFGQASLCTLTGLLLNLACRKDRHINEKVHLQRSGSFGPVHYPSISKRSNSSKAVDNMEIVIENDAEKEWNKYSTKSTPDKTEKEENELHICVNNANIHVWVTSTDSGLSVNSYHESEDPGTQTTNGKVNTITEDATPDNLNHEHLFQQLNSRRASDSKKV